ncbi:MAG TPA: hypothetical protein VNW15_14960 [Rhizomicrobium sp.]|jgi:hypothetical protein|nr:hypothetical protein [Rhizomicrobium sp.]
MAAILQTDGFRNFISRQQGDLVTIIFFKKFREGSRSSMNRPKSMVHQAPIYKSKRMAARSIKGGSILAAAFAHLLIVEAILSR